MESFLWQIIPWGYQVLLYIEGLRTPFWDALFLGLTGLGSEGGYLVILALTYWCVNKSIGQGLALGFLYSATINTWIKDLWHIPRPSSPDLEGILNAAGISARLHPLRYEPSPSFVSGHAQGAVVVWGYLAHGLKKAWVWVVAVLMIAFIGLSRMYVGVHFPQDVIGGWAIGALYLVVWVWLTPAARRWLAQRSRVEQCALVLAGSVAVLAIHPVQTTATIMGAAAGLGVGFANEVRRVRFQTCGVWWRCALRGALGMALLGLTYLILHLLLGPLGNSAISWVSLSARAVRYALLGGVCAWGVPWAFVRLGLAACDDRPGSG
jgi:glycerophosphoryl diester phosphodiesterase